MIANFAIIISSSARCYNILKYYFRNLLNRFVILQVKYLKERIANLEERHLSPIGHDCEEDGRTEAFESKGEFSILVSFSLEVFWGR